MPGSFSELFRWHMINRNHVVRPTIHDIKHCTISCLVGTTASNYSTQASEQRTKEVNFHIRGPHGFGKVYTEMFKNQADKKWTFTYLIVEIKSPSPAQLMLESYVPA
ncbi:hypothetical protein B296_00007032 [Ensete ventricosum]|uniref:Mitochondrial import inner membrane translocase subunit Tim21 n=1 Tax=Ensete ventricosum TaxID=4639 RepID=A0A427ASB5_ENSVE|nr:hypothetical protein B296_00007032 [Ensete ventricosum]